MTTTNHPSDTPVASSGPELSITIDGESVTVEGSERGDEQGSAALKAHGFRWSRTLGAWFLPRPWRADTKRRRVREFAATMQRHGRSVEVIDTGAALDAAAIHAGRRDRAADRAEYHRDRAETAEQRAAEHDAERRRISDSIPLGQPILLGHHSQARHERDLERIRIADRKDREQTERARHHQAAARSADLAASDTENPVTTKRRIERLETERREVARVLEHYTARANESVDMSGGEIEHHADLTARADELDESIRHHRARLAEAVEQGRTVQWSREHFQPGDDARTRGSWVRVVRVNRVTLSVSSGYSWTNPLPYIEVLGRRRNGVVTSNPHAPGQQEQPAEPTVRPEVPQT
ncbi:DUF3560 domain-containing protein [Kineococcus sp. R86509]|uniref:DUF3560 domain-containing protein n=1 Tax=Kineococcus sp. R86509 TaxID=3093851 RepID=UPI0036D3761A